MRFITRLQCLLDLWQHLLCQIEHDFTLRRKPQRLAFAHK